MSGHPRSLPVLSIRGLQVGFEMGGVLATVVDGVDLDIPVGRTVALVGESGCGKSVTALSILRLLPEPPARTVEGRILFHDPLGHESRDLLTTSAGKLRQIRGSRIALIFQEPMTALNPVYTIGEQIVEAIRLHETVSKRAAWERAIRLLERVGIPAASERAHDHPHRFSGGMLQRAMIAMALSCGPALLIADEPTTALDASVQGQILRLLTSLQHETGMSILLITHDLGLVGEFAHEVNVMYAGRIVEHADVRELLRRPLHPYTQAILRCSPSLSWDRESRLPEIPGSVPSPGRIPSGCRFHPRCELTAQQAKDNPNKVVVVADSISGVVLGQCLEPFAEQPTTIAASADSATVHTVRCAVQRTCLL